MQVEIIYCQEWNYGPRAVRLADELISEHGDDLVSITLVKGEKGEFEVSVDGGLIYSKRETRRHPEPGEVLKTIAASI